MTGLKKLWQLRRSTLANNIVVLLMLFGMTPLAVLFLIFQHVFLAYETESIGKRQQEIAHLLAAQVAMYLDYKQALLNNLLDSWDDTADWQLASRRLDDFLQRHPEFDEITVISPQGREVAKAAQEYVYRVQEAQDRALDAPLNAARAGSSLITVWDRHEATTSRDLRLLLPVKASATGVNGVLEAKLNLMALWQMLSLASCQADCQAFLANSGGPAAADQPPDVLAQLPAIRALGTSQTGVWQYRNPQGRQVIAANANIPGTDLTVVLERSGQGAFQQVHQIVIIFLSIFVVIICTAVFRGLLFSHDRIIRPVKAMQREVEALSRGVFPQGLPANGRDELGQLSLAFNKMVQHLKKTMVSRDLLAKEVEDRKLAEEALRRQEATLRSIFLTVPVGIGSLQDWTIVGANDSFYKLTGFGPEELLGQDFGRLFALQHEYAKVMATIRRTLSREETVIVETRWRRHDHQERDIFLKFAAIAGAESADLVFAAMDVSDLKKMEEERLRIDKLESLGILAGGIAHDFNNILTVILGNIELVGLELKKPGNCQKWLQEADEACRRAQHLAKQLLTFAKGGMPLKKPVDPVRLVQDVIPLALSGSQSAVEILCDDDIWPIEVDEDQIHQVINNILINADQAMPTGGQITVAVQNCVVTPSLGLPLAEGRYVRLSITDQGVGIGPKDLEKIFDPYFTTKQLGNGLGLTAAYSIVKNHQGHIAVESRLGKGSCFRLYLPVAPVAALPTGPKLATLPIRGQGRILVMDDEASVREVLAHMLIRLGYEPVCVKDGGQALEAYQTAQKNQEKFVAVILDLTVPGGLGGKETMELLQQLDPQVKAIVSSGYGDDPIMARYAEYGFQSVIAKPYKISDLSLVLHKVLAQNPSPRPHPHQPTRPATGRQTV